MPEFSLSPEEAELLKKIEEEYRLFYVRASLAANNAGISPKLFSRHLCNFLQEKREELGTTSPTTTDEGA